MTAPEHQLDARFLASAGQRVEALRSRLREMADGSDEAAAHAAARELHILKGDAKLLGFDAIFAAAEELERRLLDAAAEGCMTLENGICEGVDALERLVSEGTRTVCESPWADDDAQPGIRSDGQPWRILLIDDSEIALEVQRRALAGAGFEVRATTSLGTFDELLADWCPQVILADVDMPTLSGPELCRALKARYDTAHVPIVLCSALSTERLRELARECEAEGYVSKARLESLAEDLAELCEAVAW